MFLQPHLVRFGIKGKSMTVLKKIEEGVSFKKASSLPINPNKDEIASIVIVCRQVYRIL